MHIHHIIFAVMSKTLSLILISLLCLKGEQAFGAQWKMSFSNPPTAQPASLISANYQDPVTFLAASSSAVFKYHPQQGWTRLFLLEAASSSIMEIKTFPSHPESYFVITPDTLYRAFTDGRPAQIVFLSNSLLGSIHTFAIRQENPLHWFLSVGSHLLQSDNEGRSWSPFSFIPRQEPIRFLAPSSLGLFAATDTELLYSKNSEHLSPLLKISSDNEDLSDSDPSAPRNRRITDFIVSESRSLLWLATTDGIFRSNDTGGQWSRLPDSGLLDTSITRLAYVASLDRLFAATSQGIYEYENSSNRWSPLPFDFKQSRPKSLMATDRPALKIISGTAAGLREFIPVQTTSGSEVFSGSKLRSLYLLFRLEPSVSTVRQDALDYHGLNPSKIKRWHRMSRTAALLPNFSIGRDFSTSNNVDLDRGSTSVPDRYILGPEDNSRGLDFDLTWDFGDLIWSSSQTSIDSRAKALTDLRHDQLSELIRIYFERRRLQTEIVLQEPANRLSHYQNLVRLDELTAMLDGMTGGKFAERLSEVYEQYPGLVSLWYFSPPQVN